MVGQVLAMLRLEKKYQIEYFISVQKLPSLNIKAEHNRRPNRKTEFVQDGKIFGLPVLEKSDFALKLKADRIKKALVLEEKPGLRHAIFTSLYEIGVDPISWIHPTVFLGGQNTISKGVVIFPNCYIGYKTDVGVGTIIQSNCVIEHHCSIGQFCDINPRLTTAGFTQIGDFVEINLSVDIVNRIRIGTGARIGAGSLVLRDCEPGMLYYGRPARNIRANPPAEFLGKLK